MSSPGVACPRDSRPLSGGGGGCMMHTLPEYNRSGAKVAWHPLVFGNLVTGTGGIERKGSFLGV